jgi:hypothetical protein
MNNVLNRRARFRLYFRLFEFNTQPYDYTVHVVENLGDAIATIDTSRLQPGDVFVEDDDGIYVPVTNTEIRNAIYENRIKKRKIRTKAPAEFRNGPWPFTGKRPNWSRYRHPKTKSEIAANENHLTIAREIREEHAINLKDSRINRIIPTAWTEITRNTDRNWKRQRITRWR